MVSLGESHLIGIPLRGLDAGDTAIAQLSISRGPRLAGRRTGRRAFGQRHRARVPKKQAGQPMEIEGEQFRVAGVFDATNPFDANSIVAPLGRVQKLMERPDVVSEFQVRVADAMRDEAGMATDLRIDRAAPRPARPTARPESSTHAAIRRQRHRGHARHSEWLGQPRRSSSRYRLWACSILC